MSRKTQRQEGKAALEIIEEAVHLLRMAPGSVLACYYLGSLPFVLGLLYFWTEMSQSPFANDRCAPAAFALALLFHWMKWWQAEFARRLRWQIAHQPAPQRSLQEMARMAITQSFVHASGLFVLPAALVLVVPFPWVCAFYQSVTALGYSESGEIRLTLRRAMEQAGLWPRQNYRLLFVLLVLGAFVFLNLAVGMFWIPYLIKMLFGVESLFTRNPGSVLNSTFFATNCALAYLCLDPLLKAVYVLRCFYGQALQSGEDLRAELKSLLSPAPQLAAALLCSVFLGGPTSSAAAAPGQLRAAPRGSEAVEMETAPSISPRELDRAIQEVIHQREYTWRFPRDKVKRTDAEKGMFVRFIEESLVTVKGWLTTVRGWLERLKEWWDGLGRRDQRSDRSGERSWLNWLTTSQLLVFALLAIVAGALVIFFWRMWKQRHRQVEVVASQAIAARPDLADENIAADQLPEDGWMTLARELIERGDLRLALRALYLAGLAHLGQREMIRIAKHKSNREYEAELRRRARALPELHGAFAENVSVFDRAWYGMHEVTAEMLQQFRANLERIRAC